MTTAPEQPFDPAKTREKLARLEGDIVVARQLKDWPKLAAAVTNKIAEQLQFVTYWDRHVGVRHGGNRSKDTEGCSCSTAGATAAWGISQQTVSRWRKSLANAGAYRQRLMAAEPAMASPLADAQAAPATLPTASVHPERPPGAATPRGAGDNVDIETRSPTCGEQLSCLLNPSEFRTAHGTQPFAVVRQVLQNQGMIVRDA